MAGTDHPYLALLVDGANDRGASRMPNPRIPNSKSVIPSSTRKIRQLRVDDLLDQPLGLEKALLFLRDGKAEFLHN